MAYANYAAFRTAFMMLVESEEIAQASFSTGTADILIGLGESRVYSELRASTMVTALSLAPTAGVYTLPAALIELKQLYFAGEAPLEIVPLDKLRGLLNASASTNNSRFAAQDGETLKFWPDEATATVLGSYYAKPAALASITWANATTFARYPECFLFAALSESAPFLGFDRRIPVWEQKYRTALDNANHAERVRVYGGSPLRIRAR